MEELKWNFNYEYKNQQHSKTKYVIYLITNTISKKYYIGQTRRMLWKRWQDYKNDLLKPIQINKRKGSNIKLKRSVQKHFKKIGNTDFLYFSILEIVDVSVLITDEKKQLLLDEREIFHIKEYRKIYGKTRVFNVADGGKSYIFTKEDRESLSESKKIYFQTEKGLIQREKDRQSKIGKTWEERYGEEKAKVIKQKTKEAQKKRCSNKENHPFFNHNHTDESKQKIKETMENFYKTEEGLILKKKYSERMDGKTFEELYGEEKAIQLKKELSENRKGKGNPMYGKGGMLNPFAKIYDLNENPLVSPGGIYYYKIECLAVFAKQHELDNSALLKIIKGKNKSYKGWRLWNQLKIG